MADRLLAVFLILLAGAYLFATYRLPTLDIGDPLGPKAFPYLVGASAIIAAIWLLVENAAKLRPDQAAHAAEQSPDAPPAPPAERHHPLAVAAVLGGLLVFYLLFEPLGFVISCTGFLLGFTAYFNRGRWFVNVPVSLLFPIGVYFAFTSILGVSLPRGPLPF